MGRGGKVGCNTNFKRRGNRWADNGSDDSDEDYVVSDEKGVMSDDSADCGSFLDDSASEKSFGDYGDERKVAVRKVARAKLPKGFSGRRKRTGLKVSRRSEREFCDDGDDDDDEDYGVRRVKTSSKRKRKLSDDDDDDYDVSGKASPERKGEFHDDEVDDDASVKASLKRKRELHDDDDNDDDDDDNDEDYVVNEGDDDVSVKASPKRKRDLRDDDNDEDYVVNDDDVEEEEEEEGEEEEDEEFTPEDEEFTLDDDDCLDEEEECRVTKKVHNKKVGGPVRGRKRRKRSNSSRVLKKPLQKKGAKRRRLRRTVKSDDGGGVSASIDKLPAVREKSRKNPTGRSRRKHVVQSDSDFASSGSSDFDYTISEEEREQIREGREITVNLRSSTSSKKIEDDSFLGQLKWPPRRKGKEKIEEAKIEVGKQICGICLTEEDRRRVRGTLNCCSHYFCFTCIMAWSKVETRCPLCKQRFQSISKPARSNAGVDLRTMVMQVPERDQVYQPSEEEIRSYFDPYENVLCTECHLGGDDALMLLCDSCDSPAHTYCVGLGHEVPEGNWYCEGCRPIALGSSSSQAEGHVADQRTTNNLSNISSSPVINSREGIDLNSFPSPHTTSSPGFGFLPSPRHSVGDGRAASPVTGAGAPTLSGRRWVHRQIQNLLSRNRMTAAMANRDSGISAANSNMGPPPNCTIFEDRLPENSSPLVQNMDVFASRLNHLRRQTVQNPDAGVADRAVDGTLWDRRAGIDYFPGFEQLHHYSSRPSIASGDGVPQSTFGDDIYLHKENEQVQSMVKTHLQSLSRDIGLDHTTLEEVARRSTHTTLAACGLEHTISEVCLEPQPFICPHIEIVAAGQTSLMKSSCPSCFDSFVRDVVKRILNTKLPPWLVGTRV